MMLLNRLLLEIPALNLDHDELDGNGIQRDPHEFWWADPENVTEFFKQVKNFLDPRAHVCRDLRSMSQIPSKIKTRLHLLLFLVLNVCGKKTLLFR